MPFISATLAGILVLKHAFATFLALQAKPSLLQLKLAGLLPPGFGLFAFRPYTVIQCQIHVIYTLLFITKSLHFYTFHVLYINAPILISMTRALRTRVVWGLLTAWFCVSLHHCCLSSGIDATPACRACQCTSKTCKVQGHVSKVVVEIWVITGQV